MFPERPYLNYKGRGGRCPSFCDYMEAPPPVGEVAKSFTILTEGAPGGIVGHESGAFGKNRK